MLAGIPMSKLMLTSMSQALSSDVFTMPVTITYSAYFAFVVTGLPSAAQRSSQENQET